MSDRNQHDSRSPLRRALLGLALLASTTQIACATDTIVAPITGTPAEIVITLDPSATEQPVSGVQSIGMEVGQSTMLVATQLDALGRPVAGAAVSWSSTDSNVVTVDGAGQVTAVGAGTAEIVAAAGELFDTLRTEVTVPAAPPS